MPALETIATYKLSSALSLLLARGSVLDYAPKVVAKAALVNAANTACLGGGGVDGAISNAGGPNLARDREALPILEPPDVRCPVGRAVITGPGTYGALATPYVIHAVGPDYWEYDDDEEFADALLKSAYTSALDCAAEAGLTHVAFALLSAGIFRGPQSLEHVLQQGVLGIVEFSQRESSLQEIVLCAYNPRECRILQAVCDDILLDDDDKNKKRRLEAQRDSSEMQVMSDEVVEEKKECVDPDAAKDEEAVSDAEQAVNEENESTESKSNDK